MSYLCACGLTRLLTVNKRFSCLIRAENVSHISDHHWYTCRWVQLLAYHEMSRSMTKPTNWPVRLAKTQISLGIQPVWSESSLCAQWVAKDPRFLHADSEDWSEWADAQADLSLRIRPVWSESSLGAHVIFLWFCHAAAQIQIQEF